MVLNVTALQGLLEALREDPSDPLSWAALGDWCEENSLPYVATACRKGPCPWALRELYPLAYPEETSAIEDCQWHQDYAEPGYSTPENGIVTGNYNDCPMFSAALEALGVELEWEDEWSACHDCGKLVRTEPDGHDWAPSYRWEGESTLLCLECYADAHPPEEPEDEPEAQSEPENDD